MIKKVKIEKVIIKDEKEVTSKKTGQVYKLCPVSILVADDCSSGFAGKWMNTGMFEYIDPKDPKKNKSANNKAEYFKTQMEGKQEWIEITERPYVNKEGVDSISLEFKTLSKAKKEVAEEMSK